MTQHGYITTSEVLAVDLSSDFISWFKNCIFIEDLNKFFFTEEKNKTAESKKDGDSSPSTASEDTPEAEEHYE